MDSRKDEDAQFHGVLDLSSRWVAMNISLVLMIVALVLFALSAFGVASPRVNLQSAGLFCWVLSMLIR